MLVRLTSSTSGDMIMFAEHARRLFEIVGKECTARGVFTCEQLPEAITRLKEAIAEGWLVELATTLPPMQRTLSIVLHRAKKLGAAAEGFLRHCTTD